MPRYPPRGRSRRVVTVEDVMVLAQVKVLSWYVTAGDRSRETVGNKSKVELWVTFISLHNLRNFCR